MEKDRGQRKLTIFFRVKKDIPLGLINIVIGGGGMRGGVERERKGTRKRLWDLPKVEAKPHCDNVAGLKSALDVVWGKSCLGLTKSFP